jgi:hypothetical protein
MAEANRSPSFGTGGGGGFAGAGGGGGGGTGLARQRFRSSWKGAFSVGDALVPTSPDDRPRRAMASI